jgi:peptidoglycan/xylan/chitin deacetylase (PgdA/CDA1 family)
MRPAVARAVGAAAHAAPALVIIESLATLVAVLNGRSGVAVRKPMITQSGLAVVVLVAILGSWPTRSWAQAPPDRLVRDKYGAIIRGDVTSKSLALVFTGDEHGESMAPILDALQARKVQAGFFVTGNFMRQPKLRRLLKRAVAAGHYVGPHSDDHTLYCSWEDRERSLVTREVFAADLRKNIADLRRLGAMRGNSEPLFIPPYEWYNREQVRWCGELGVTLINFTPGSGSNRDYAPEGDRRFVPSQTIYNDILAYEKQDPDGLNGFILLLHLGSGRKDPFHPLLGRLCDELAERSYEIVRVDTLISQVSK